MNLIERVESRVIQYVPTYIRDEIQREVSTGRISKILKPHERRYVAKFLDELAENLIEEGYSAKIVRRLRRSAVHFISNP